jgi:hypothetical protein
MRLFIAKIMQYIKHIVMFIIPFVQKTTRTFIKYVIKNKRTIIFVFIFLFLLLVMYTNYNSIENVYITLCRYIYKIVSEFFKSDQETSEKTSENDLQDSQLTEEKTSKETCKDSQESDNWVDNRPSTEVAQPEEPEQPMPEVKKPINEIISKAQEEQMFRRYEIRRTEEETRNNVGDRNPYVKIVDEETHKVTWHIRNKVPKTVLQQQKIKLLADAYIEMDARLNDIDPTNTDENLENIEKDFENKCLSIIKNFTVDPSNITKESIEADIKQGENKAQERLDET